MTRRPVPHWATDVIARCRGGAGRRIAQSAEIVIERGRGSYLYSTAGSRYLDVIAGHGVASLGHSHPRWVDAVVEQAGRLVVTPLDTDPLAHYLEALSLALPARVDRVALFSTGAESVEAAVRLAQTATGRPGLLTFEHGFHGKTAALRYSSSQSSPEARSLAPHWLRTARFPACQLHGPLAYAECEESVADTIAAIEVRTDLDDVGTVLAEPVLGTSGNIPPRRRFLSALRRLCDKRGWLLALDESVTGFGRTGELFAFDYFGVDPDVVVLGKGLGGGAPLGAVCASSELWGSSALAAPSATSTSFGGNPLSCAAGLATLEIVTGEKFLDDVRRVARHAAQRLDELAKASMRVARPRGVGLMLGFDLVEPETGVLASAEACAAVFRACRDRGVLLLADVPRVRLSPPLTIATREVDELFDVLLEVLT